MLFNFDQFNACLHFDSVFHTNHTSFSLDILLKNILDRPIHESDTSVSLQRHPTSLTLRAVRPAVRRGVFLESGESVIEER